MGRPDEVEPVFERIRARGVVRFDRKAGRRRAGGRCNVDGDGGFGEILPEDGSKEGRVVRPIRGDSQREASDEVRTVDGIPRLQGDRNVHPTMAARFDVFRLPAIVCLFCLFDRLVCMFLCGLYTLSVKLADIAPPSDRGQTTGSRGA